MKKLEWVLAVALGALLLVSALARIVSSDARGDMSDALNVPGWFLILVSLWEIVIAIDLFLPRFRILGGVGAAVTMIGAALFNLFGDTVNDTNPRQFIPVNIVLALAGLGVAWLAAGRPTSIGALVSAAKQQLRGQIGEVAETAADLT